MSFSSSCKVSGAVGARGSESRVLTLRTVPFRTKSSLNGSTNGCRASEKKSGNKNKLFISLENRGKRRPSRNLHASGTKAKKTSRKTLRDEHICIPRGRTDFNGRVFWPGQDHDREIAREMLEVPCFMACTVTWNKTDPSRRELRPVRMFTPGQSGLSGAPRLSLP